MRLALLSLAVLAMFALISSPAGSQGRQRGQVNPATPPPAIPVLAYQRLDWPRPAAGLAGFADGPWQFLDVPAIAPTADGHIFVFSRSPHPLLEFDGTGVFVRSLGEGMVSDGRVRPIPQAEWLDGHSHFAAGYGPTGCPGCGAHAVRLDPQGNLWMIDAGGHVIYKMTRDGKEIMRLGTRGTAGAGNNTFNLPTDVAFAANGDIYVTDGYGNARVVKFSRDGNYLREWGSRGRGPGQFGCPHNVVVDAEGKVYVNDRDNQRIEIFDSEGTFLSELPGLGSFNALNITKDHRLWTGGVLRDLTGTALGRLPEMPLHAMTVTDAGDVYLSKSGGVIVKFIKQ